MKLSRDQVKKVAKLANLSLSSDEEDSPRFAGEAGKYSEQLSKILDYIDQLNKVNTESVEPTFNITGNSNVLANDEIKDSLSQEEALQNGSFKKDGFFVTKGVFDNE